MKIASHIVNLLSLTITFTGLVVSLHAQSSGCIGQGNPCTKKTKFGDDEVEFKYYFIKHDSLYYENGIYLLKANDSIEIRIAVIHDIQSSVISFKKEWLETNSLFGYNTSREFEGFSSRKLRLILQNKNQKNAKMVLPFGIGKDKNSIKTYSDTLEFSFSIKGEVEIPEEKDTTNLKSVVKDPPPKTELIDTVEGSGNITSIDSIEFKDTLPDDIPTSPSLQWESNKKIRDTITDVVDGDPTKEVPKQERVKEVKEEDRDENAWTETVNKNTIKAYRDFEENYQNSNYIEESKARRRHITLEYSEETENEIILINVFKPVVVNTPQNPGYKSRIEKISGQLYRQKLIVYDIETQKNIEIEVKDPTKPNQVNKRTIHIGRILEVNPDSVIISEGKTYIKKIRFKNGAPPYKITFISASETDTRHIDSNEYKIVYTGKDSTIAVWQPVDTWFEGLHGNITFRISDSELNKPFEHVDWRLTRQKKDGDRNTAWFLGIGLVPVGFIVLLVALKSARRKRKKEEWEKKRSEKWTSYLSDVEHQKEIIFSNTSDIEEGGNQYATEKTQTEAKTSGIIIKSIKKASSKAIKYEDERKLEKILLEEFAFSFTMTELWQDSSVSEIYFKEDCVTTLDDFIWQQNLSPLMEAKTEIPEIGGIFIGKAYQHKDKNIHKVHVEKFVPIDPEYHDVYRFEFSKESIAKDLGNIQKQHPDLMLIGWFHTHPGHGLFLSKPDLRIHDSFFKESYQFAMEIDTLTKQLDTAFFTRMKNNKVNNRKNLKEHAKWFSWSKATNADQ